MGNDLDAWAKRVEVPKSRSSGMVPSRPVFRTRRKLPIDTTTRTNDIWNVFSARRIAMNIATLRETFLKGSLRPYSRKFTTSPAASLPASLPQAFRRKRGYAPAHPSAAPQSGWPTVILAEAARSGFLKMDVATATQILDTFDQQGTLSADQLCRSQ